MTAPPRCNFPQVLHRDLVDLVEHDYAEWKGMKLGIVGGRTKGAETWDKGKRVQWRGDEGLRHLVEQERIEQMPGDVDLRSKWSFVSRNLRVSQKVHDFVFALEDPI